MTPVRQFVQLSLEKQKSSTPIRFSMVVVKKGEEV